MRIAVKFEAFNAHKYSKPWIGIVTTWPVGGKPVIRFGRFIGTDDGGEAEIEQDRFGVSEVQMASVRLAVVGLALILVTLYRPNGVFNRSTST